MILPLFGVMAMEAGAISPFIDAPGDENGATIAYLLHLAFFFTAFHFALRYPTGQAAQRLAATPKSPALGHAQVDSYARFCVCLFFVFALLMLFVFGGIDVFLLNVDKAEFRISLGPFGALMTIATKWIIPAMFAALVAAVRSVGWTSSRRIQVGLSGLLLAVVGASWGFKTTIIMMLLPAIILVAWTVKARVFFLLAVFFVGNIVVFSLLFDQHEDIQLVFEALLYRLTVLQGDLAWYTWESVSRGYETPPYLRTFLPMLGDGLLRRITGANPEENYAEWASYYFGPSMTLFGGYPVEGVQAGVTNQATMFAESLVVGGLHCYVVVSGFFGAVVGGVASKLKSAINCGDYQLSATLATFYSFAILSWSLGNGFSSLFYLINLVGGLVTYFLIDYFLKSAVQAND